MPAAFELQNVTMSYPRSKTPALNNVSLVVPQNAICGLFGRNAAGKTSLMALLAAFRRPTSGTVRVFGQDPYENPYIATQVAFIYANNNPNSFVESCNNYCKVRELLKLGKKFRPTWGEDFAAHLCKRFDLNPKKWVGRLSLGQKAALRCTIGLASRAPLTIFDEAYLGMDAIYRRIFVDELLADYLRNPRTILFSTHYVAEMERLFSEAIIINEGVVLAHDDADSLRAGKGTQNIFNKTSAVANTADTTTSSLQDIFIRLAIKEGETYEPANFI
jgi:ABC-2 type transport system ATP-binding protein